MIWGEKKVCRGPYCVTCMKRYRVPTPITIPIKTSLMVPLSRKSRKKRATIAQFFTLIAIFMIYLVAAA